MSIITRALSIIGIERRAVDQSWNGAALLRSGGTSPGAAESLSTVYACVAAISETLASLPLILYKRTPDGGREPAIDHPLHFILAEQPNENQTALEFREMMQAMVLLRGNAHAEIVRDFAGQVSALIPIPGDRITTLYLDNGRLAFDVSDRLGNVRRLLQSEVLHLRHRSTDGLIGVSPITASRQTVELALAERDHGNSTFTNGAKLSGVLKFPQKLKADQRTALSNSWTTQYSGGANAGKTAILEEGVEYQTISMSNADSEYLASRQFSVAEICRLFRVPPTLAGDMGHANYSNSVELSRQFITLTLKRHFVMWEQAISRALLSPTARQVYFAEHNVDGLLRGDATNRADFYSKGLSDGWLQVDEVRHLENLPKLAATAPPAPALPTVPAAVPPAPAPAPPANG
jgi:HK97 family phage portal protein